MFGTDMGVLRLTGHRVNDDIFWVQTWSNEWGGGAYCYEITKKFADRHK
jgi:hypothetical protein